MNYFNKKGKVISSIIEKLNETISQEGTILELKAINSCAKKGYFVNEFFYKDLITGKNRQLDLIAHKRKTFKLFNTTIHFDMHLVGDCKYKSEMDILFFDTGFKYDNVFDFPIKFNADLIPEFGHVDKGHIPFTSSKVTQINPSLIGKIKSKKNEHLDDKIIYCATQQVFSGVSSFYNELKDELKKRKERIYNRRADIVREYEECKKQGSNFYDFI
ncbi:MAG: hypothetical protein KAQ92_04765, partial [Candidatus Aenigmarchaeota archaeon]|nr:hypothetical protein [Candidatus Aenigmarchaeota archaeon]